MPNDSVRLEAIEPSSLSFGTKLLNAFKSKLQAEITISSDDGVDVCYSIGKFEYKWAKSTAY